MLNGNQTQRWTAIEFESRALLALGEAQDFVDAFTDPLLSHSMSTYNAWHSMTVSGGVIAGHKRGRTGQLDLAVQGVASLETTRTVTNVVRWPSEIEFAGLRFGPGNVGTDSFRVAVTAGSFDWSVALTVNSIGQFNLAESGGSGRQVLFESVIPSLCLSNALSGQIRLTADAWSIVLNCSHTVIEETGQFPAPLTRYVPGWTGDCRLGLSVAGSDTSAVSLDRVSARRVRWTATPKPPTLPVVLGPVVNGVELGDGTLGAAQPLAALGFLDVTKSPFLADPSGGKDSTEALQRAFDFGRQAYLTVYLPSGTYSVSATLTLTDPSKMFLTTVGSPFCNNMAEVWPASNRTQRAHCSRTAPAILQGSRTGGRAVLELAKNVNLKGPVLQVHNPENENINMNQIVSNLDIRILDGNENAQGVYARAAQGTSVQDVTIYAGTASCGLVGGAGSGGSHINVTVIGGQVGIDVSQAQPSPTLVAVTLVDQLASAIVYSAPGRQTLSIVGATIQQLATATGPAVLSSNPISIADSIITTTAPSATALTSSGSTYLRNVYLTGFKTLVDSGPNGSTILPTSSQWTCVRSLALGKPGFQSAITPVFWNGTQVPGSEYSNLEGSTGPPPQLAEQHAWGASFPSFQTPGLCNVKDAQYGAKGDYTTDDTAAVQKALDDPACSTGIFLPKGYYAVSKTLTLPKNAVVVGASRIYSNIVPHASVAPYVNQSTNAWPLVATSAGQGTSTTIYALSVIVWHHFNSTFAVQWQCENGYWREAHTNRVDVNPGVVGPAARYSQPLNKIISGGGKFYNFYQVWTLRSHMFVAVCCSRLTRTCHSPNSGELGIPRPKLPTSPRDRRHKNPSFLPHEHRAQPRRGQLRVSRRARAHSNFRLQGRGQLRSSLVSELHISAAFGLRWQRIAVSIRMPVSTWLRAVSPVPLSARPSGKFCYCEHHHAGRLGSPH